MMTVGFSRVSPAIATRILFNGPTLKEIKIPSCPVDPWLSLAAAIVAKAAMDVEKNHDPAAAEWLKSDECLFITEVLNLNHEAIQRWVAQQQAAAKILQAGPKQEKP